MHQAAVLQADVHKGAEIDHVQDRSFELHGGLQIFELEDAFFENGRRQVLARVAAGPGQGLQNVRHRGQTRTQPVRQIKGRQRLELGLQFLGAAFILHNVRPEAQVGQDLAGDGVAFRMDPGAVKRVFALVDLEEAGRLHVAGRAYPRDVLQMVPALERPMLFAVIDQLARHHLVETGHVPQEGYAGGVQVHPNLVDARFDHAVEGIAQVAAFDVVLVEAHADALRIDLDQLAEGVLQAAADGDGAAQGAVKRRELLAADGADRVHAGPRLVDDDVGQLGQVLGDELGDQLFGFAAAGAVADGYHLDGVLDNHVLQLGHGLIAFGWRRRRGGGRRRCECCLALRNGNSGGGFRGIRRSRCCFRRLGRRGRLGLGRRRRRSLQRRRTWQFNLARAGRFG